MLDELLVKIRHRRNTSIVSLLMFLHNGQYPQSNDFFSYSTKHNIKITAKQIYEKLFVEPEPDPESPEVILQAQSEICEVNEDDQDSLSKTLTTFLASPILESTPQLEKELKMMEGNGKRTPNLEKLYKALITIKPTSVDCERTFSIAGNFCTKIRSKLMPETLSNLVFLKYYFKETK